MFAYLTSTVECATNKAHRMAERQYSNVRSICIQIVHQEKSGTISQISRMKKIVYFIGIKIMKFNLYTVQLEKRIEK